MRKSVAATVGILIVGGVLASTSGHVRGAVSALADQSRGRTSTYSLGCTDSVPRDPYKFRVRELLERDFKVRYIVIGGIAPSDYQADFASSYDMVTYRLMRWRFGNDFVNRVEQQAKRDIFERPITVEGCYFSVSREVRTAPNQFIRVAGDDPAIQALEALDRRTVRIAGRVTDVHDSNWFSSGYPVIHFTRVAALGQRCGTSPD